MRRSTSRLGGRVVKSVWTAEANATDYYISCHAHHRRVRKIPTTAANALTLHVTCVNNLNAPSLQVRDSKSSYGHILVGMVTGKSSLKRASKHYSTQAVLVGPVPSESHNTTMTGFQLDDNNKAEATMRIANTHLCNTMRYSLFSYHQS